MSVKVVFNNIATVEAAILGEMGGVVAAAAMNIEATAKASMTEPKTGREYKRKNAKHRASAPGQAPAIDISALANSIQADTTDADSQLRAEVNAGTEYAEALELGTGRIAPRPFLTPAAEAERPILQKAAESAVRRAAKRHSKIAG